LIFGILFFALAGIFSFLLALQDHRNDAKAIQRYAKSLRDKDKKDDEVDTHNFYLSLQTCDIFCRNCKKTSVLEFHLENRLLGYIVHPRLDSKLVNMKDAVVVEKVKQNRKMFSLLIYCPVCGLLADILDDVPNNYNVLSGKEIEEYIHIVSFR